MDREPQTGAVNPIVAMATRMRARRDLGAVIDAAPAGESAAADDAEGALRAFARDLQSGTARLNSILGKDGVKFISLERPLRIRLRFREKRAGLDLDAARQLIKVSGLGLEGEYQFDPAAGVPALINLSKISTETGYGERLTPSSLLKLIAEDAEIPRPSHLDSSGPLQL